MHTHYSLTVPHVNFFPNNTAHTKLHTGLLVEPHLGHTHGICANTIPVLQMSKLTPSEIKLPAQGPTVNR